MQRFYFLFSITLNTFLQFTFAQNFEVTILVSDGKVSGPLVLGVNPAGTDEFDIGLDELAPPPPPGGAFDRRFTNLSEDYFNDIRDNSISEKQFHMSYMPSTGNGPIVLYWDSSYIDSLGSFFIVDDINGNYFGPLDMKTTDSLVVTDALIISGLRILVTPYSWLNHPPELDPISDQNMNEGDSLNVPLNCTDPDGDNIALSSPNLPDFGNLIDNGDGKGVITFRPQIGDAGFYPDILVMATDDGQPSSLTDTITFTLIVSMVALVITSPNGGEVWELGSTHDITWTAGDIGDLQIDLFISDTLSVLSITSQTSNDGTFTWDIPYNLEPRDDYKIFVGTANWSTYDFSDNTFTIDNGTSVTDWFPSEIPTGYILCQNFPNPFNASTRFYFGIPERSYVKLCIFNISGEKIVELIKEYKDAGNYSIYFNFEHNPSGVYLYRLEAGNYIETKKMILMK